jgi:hypothetical protein
MKVGKLGWIPGQARDDAIGARDDGDGGRGGGVGPGMTVFKAARRL